MAVHRELGCGFLEPVYQRAFACELTQREVPFQREVEIPVFYRGKTLELNYRADFICLTNIIVEIKSIQKLSNIEKAQVINYLKATGFKKAPLLNFGTSTLQYKRLVLSKHNLRRSA